MRKTSVILTIVAVQVIGGSFAFAATNDDPADPTSVSVSPCTPNPCMSLQLYKSLREKALSLSESQPTDVDTDAAPKVDPSAILMQLAAEVREHETQILDALASPRSIQRELAARVLSLVSDKKAAVGALCTVLSKDSDDDVRTTAAFTLGRLNDASAVDTLIAGLRDSSESVRTQCAASLGRLRDERAVSELMQMLRSEARSLLRLQAATALGQIKTGVSETDLTSLLESEGDERVKMAIAAAIRVITGSKIVDATDVPEQGDYAKQLSDLSGTMKDVAHKLRDDRFDETVQVDQNDIDEKLSDMIRELEKMQQLKVEKSEKDSKKAQSRRRLAMMMGEEQQSSNPRAAQKPPPPAANEARLNAGKVVGRENWAALPQAERDELLQVFRPEVPLRWRKRLEAYFISLAAEEAKAENK